MVERKSVGEVILSLKTGLNPRQNFKLNTSDSHIPYITGKDIFEDKINVSDKTDKINLSALLLINKRACLESGLLLFASTGTGTVGRMAVVNYYNNDWAISETLYAIKPSNSILPQYLKYCLYSSDAKKQFEPKISKGSVPHLKIADLLKVKVPVPSLSEQERIVGILDKFTKTIENLKQQIELHGKQYSHYRDKLLDIEGKPSTDIHTWGEFCEMIKGNGVQKTDFVDEGIGCIHYGQIYTHYGSFTYSTNKFVSKETFDKARKASKGDIIMTDTSENVEDICKSVAYLGAEDIAVSNHALIIKHQQNPKFLSYSTLTRSFFNQKRKVVVGVKVSGIKPVHLAQIKIYLPSLSEQQRIVGILDRFEASISNMEQQLSERQKQYEYYRNKLLTFD